MSKKTTNLIAAVIRNHTEWYGEAKPESLALEIIEVLYKNPAFPDPLTEDDVEAVRRIVFPAQAHDDDIQWGRTIISNAIQVADIIRERK